MRGMIGVDMASIVEPVCVEVLQRTILISRPGGTHDRPILRGHLAIWNSV